MINEEEPTQSKKRPLESVNRSFRYSLNQLNSLFSRKGPSNSLAKSSIKRSGTGVENSDFSMRLKEMGIKQPEGPRWMNHKITGRKSTKFRGEVPLLSKT